MYMYIHFYKIYVYIHPHLVRERPPIQMDRETNRKHTCEIESTRTREQVGTQARERKGERNKQREREGERDQERGRARKRGNEQMRARERERGNSRQKMG